MSDIGVRLSNEELDAMMNEADTNKDGKIDYIGQATTIATMDAFRDCTFTGSDYDDHINVISVYFRTKTVEMGRGIWPAC